MLLKRKVPVLLLCAALLLAASSCSGTGTQQPQQTGPQQDPGQTALPDTVTVTIIEGQALVQIFETLEQKGVCSFDALMQQALTGDYSAYPLISANAADENRCFELEGYLFPDTYEFYTNSDAQQVIAKFLDNAENRITAQHRERAAQLGYTVQQIITVASIIEKEGAHPEQAAKIAGVIYNRLKAGQQLQMDTSIFYIEKYVKPYITGDIDRYSAYYNTYKCAALPEGPICNPGLIAIEAALNPADVPYYYFCHDAQGNYYYEEEYAQHSRVWASIASGE